MNIEEQKEQIQIPDSLLMNSSGIDGIYEKRVHLSKTSKALNDLVIIELIDQEKLKGEIDGIILPDEALCNMELLKGRVLSAGPEAIKDGVRVGDIILYDRYSAFYNPPVKVGVCLITRADNVIVKFPFEDGK
jgi:co-chaperonin GroES (HSP10)